MKLKSLAAAMALAAAGAPAFAAISTVDLSSELFVVVWDENVGSFTKDLGITLGSVLNTPSNLSFNLCSANFSAYLAADTNLSDATAISGTRWALFAVDAEIPSGGPGEANYLTTASIGASNPAPSNIALVDNIGNLATLAGDWAQTGTHTAIIATNGDSFNAKGAQGAYVEDNYFGLQNVRAGNAFGATSSLFYYSTSSFDSTAVSGRVTLPTTVSFNGTTLSVSAVPEPGSIGLLLAGLSALGFVGRRLKRD